MSDFQARVETLRTDAAAEVSAARAELTALFEQGEAIRARLMALGIPNRIDLHKHFNAKLTDIHLSAGWEFKL